MGKHRLRPRLELPVVPFNQLLIRIENASDECTVFTQIRRIMLISDVRCDFQLQLEGPSVIDKVKCHRLRAERRFQVCTADTPDTEHQQYHQNSFHLFSSIVYYLYSYGIAVQRGKAIPPPVTSAFTQMSFGLNLPS